METMDYIVAWHSPHLAKACEPYLCVHGLNY